MLFTRTLNRAFSFTGFENITPSKVDEIVCVISIQKDHEDSFKFLLEFIR